MDTPTDRSHRSYHRLPVNLRARCRVVLAAVCVTACGVSLMMTSGKLAGVPQ